MPTTIDANKSANPALKKNGSLIVQRLENNASKEASQEG